MTEEDITAGMLNQQLGTRLISPEFEADCRRQSILVAQAEEIDTGVVRLLDGALLDLEGWTD